MGPEEGAEVSEETPAETSGGPVESASGGQAGVSGDQTAAQTESSEAERATEIIGETMVQGGNATAGKDYMTPAPEAAGAVLDRVAGITGRTLLGRTEDTARFAIHMERDIREALFFAFAEAGLPLLELRPRTASLEEVFLDLTDDNDTVAARAAALFQTSVETAEKEAVGDESDL